MAPKRIFVVSIVALVLGAGRAFAAPTCQDFEGHIARCGSAHAMPVGWTPTPAQLFDRPPVANNSPTVAEAAAMVYVVGAVFAIIALMPPFDGRKGEDWDEQEGDERRK
jgi:hypothetical protein